ncbi:MAG: hypothetical protein H6647_09375 [Anaerolineales bacterium]|nr:hypothetical protein [Anaerolineales bacterium]
MVLACQQGELWNLHPVHAIVDRNFEDAAIKAGARAVGLEGWDVPELERDGFWPEGNATGGETSRWSEIWGGSTA